MEDDRIDVGHLVTLAVQVEPMKPMLKAPVSKRLKT
jgi:hypothetical protein